MPVKRTRRQLLTRLEERWSDCERCELHKTRQNVVVWRGNPNARILCMGEAPGEKEDEEGIPFIGRAGRKADECLQLAGLDPSRDVIIGNCVGCRPPGNGEPTTVQCVTCAPLRKAMMRIVRPRVVVFFGGNAMWRFLELQKKPAITKWAGKVLDVEIEEEKWSWRGVALPTFHPSYLLRTGREDLEQAVVDVLKLAAREAGLSVGVQ